MTCLTSTGGIMFKLNLFEFTVLAITMLWMSYNFIYL